MAKISDSTSFGIAVLTCAGNYFIACMVSGTLVSKCPSEVIMNNSGSIGGRLGQQ
jgi:hypothetical protein